VHGNCLYTDFLFVLFVCLRAVPFVSTKKSDLIFFL
jgi:hypothetical protein